MGLPEDLTEPGEVNAALGEWYANTLNVGRQRFLHYLSEKGRLSIIITLRERHTAEMRFLRHLRSFLRALGIPEKLIELELAANSQMTLARARDRSVLGSMNDHAFHASILLRHGDQSLYDVMGQLADMPAGPLNMESADRVVPRLLEEHWGGPRPVA